MASKVYLSRRNLLTLLSKLDRKALGEDTKCSIIKNDNTHAKYPQSTKSCQIIVVEDIDYYLDRQAGIVLDADNPDKSKTYLH